MGFGFWHPARPQQLSDARRGGGLQRGCLLRGSELESALWGLAGLLAPQYQAYQSEKPRRTGSGPEQSFNPILQVSARKIHIILLPNTVHGIQEISLTKKSSVG